MGGLTQLLQDNLTYKSQLQSSFESFKISVDTKMDAKTQQQKQELSRYIDSQLQEKLKQILTTAIAGKEPELVSAIEKTIDKNQVISDLQDAIVQHFHNNALPRIEDAIKRDAKTNGAVEIAQNALIQQTKGALEDEIEASKSKLETKIDGINIREIVSEVIKKQNIQPEVAESIKSAVENAVEGRLAIQTIDDIANKVVREIISTKAIVAIMRGHIRQQVKLCIDDVINDFMLASALKQIGSFNRFLSALERGIDHVERIKHAMEEIPVPHKERHTKTFFVD